MFKKENLVWLYFIGIIILLILVYFVARDYVLPIVRGERGTRIDSGFNYEAPPAMILEKGKDYRLRINTAAGTITADLFETNAPQNVNNLVYLATQGYYDGTYFHRLVPGLFIQGGDRNTVNDDPNDDGFGSPGYVVNDEINWDSLSFDVAKRDELTALGYSSRTEVSSKPLKKYAIAMASSGPNSNGAQFFIVLAEDLDSRLAEMSGKFTVVGEVILGRDVLASLGATEVDASNQLVPRPIRRLTATKFEIFTAN